MILMPTKAEPIQNIIWSPWIIRNISLPCYSALYIFKTFTARVQVWTLSETNKLINIVNMFHFLCSYLNNVQCAFAWNDLLKYLDLLYKNHISIPSIYFISQKFDLHWALEVLSSHKSFLSCNLEANRN